MLVWVIAFVLTVLIAVVVGKILVACIERRQQQECLQGMFIDYFRIDCDAEDNGELKKPLTPADLLLAFNQARPSANFESVMIDAGEIDSIGLYKIIVGWNGKEYPANLWVIPK